MFCYQPLSILRPNSERFWRIFFSNEESMLARKSDRPTTNETMSNIKPFFISERPCSCASNNEGELFSEDPKTMYQPAQVPPKRRIFFKTAC